LIFCLFALTLCSCQQSATADANWGVMFGQQLGASVAESDRYDREESSELRSKGGRYIPVRAAKPDDVQTVVVDTCGYSGTITSIKGYTKFDNGIDAVQFSAKYRQLLTAKYPNWEYRAVPRLNQQLLTNGVYKILISQIDRWDEEQRAAKEARDAAESRNSRAARGAKDDGAEEPIAQWWEVSIDYSYAVDAEEGARILQQCEAEQELLQLESEDTTGL